MLSQATWITAPICREFVPQSVYHKEYKPLPIPDPPLKNLHIGFRRSFSASKSTKQQIYITADDYYKLYINGSFVGQGPKPGYPEHQCYNRYDISSYVCEGENSIAVHVYYNGEINRSYQSGDQRCGLLVAIYEDGQVILETGDDWRCHILEEYRGTKQVGYKTAYLEDLDFRYEQKGWRQGSFDDSSWQQAIRFDAADYSLLTEATPTVTVYDMAPSMILAISQKHYIIDMGEEISGQFYLRARGKRGDTITIRHAEELQDESMADAFSADAQPKLRYDLRANCRYEETVTLSGEEDEVLFFDYKAFRYVELIANSDSLDPTSFKALRRHHPFLVIQTLETANTDLKRIWDICLNSIRCSAQEILVDCPTREKGQYLGDFTVSGLAYLYLSGDSAYVRAILRDFANSASICPGLMAVVPGSFMQEIADFSLLYPLQVLHLYRYTEDRTVLEEFYPTILGILRHFEQFEQEDGLIETVNDKWNLVDWPDNLRDNYDFELPQAPIQPGLHNVINAYYIGAWQVRDEIAYLLNLAVDEKRAERRRRAYLDAFYDPATKRFRDTPSSNHHSLHANVLPAFFGLVPEEARESVQTLILSRGLRCGVFFSYFVLKGLCRLGATDEAYLLMLNESEQGWINMLREGATTCFEAWGKEQKWNTSLCHPWASAPIILLNEDFKGRYGNRIIE